MGGLKRCRRNARREGLLETRTELCMFTSAPFGVQLPHFCIEIKLIKCKVSWILLDELTPVSGWFWFYLTATNLRLPGLKFSTLCIRHLRSVSCFLLDACYFCLPYIVTFQWTNNTNCSEDTGKTNSDIETFLDSSVLIQSIWKNQWSLSRISVSVSSVWYPPALFEKTEHVLDI